MNGCRIPGPRAKEVTVLAKHFEKPVCVWVGLGFPRQINTVVDAYQFLLDWCGNSPEQKAAMRACKAALAGEVDADTARGVLVAFARKKDILVEDETMPPMATKVSPRHL
nr:DUF982 domain-containing protein [Pseudaminobacter soli]